jgi:Flp pilus assembly protein CpaB
MRRGSMILTIVGILLAVTTAVIAYVALVRRPAAPPAVATPTPEKMVEAVIALQDIPAYTDIPADAVGTQEIAQSKLTNHLLAPEAVIGRRASRTILRGSFIMSDWIVDPETVVLEGRNASLNITPDREGRPRVAMAFETTELGGVAGAIQNGDFVDILISYDLVDTEQELPEPEEPALEACAPECPERRPVLAAQLVLQDVEVYRVGAWLLPTPVPTPEEGEEVEGEPQPEPIRSRILTLLLTQQDALVLKFARESGAAIDLVLRGIDDHETVRTETVSLQYVMTRFDITLPPEPWRYVVQQPGAESPAGE